MRVSVDPWWSSCVHEDVIVPLCLSAASSVLHVSFVSSREKGTVHPEIVYLICFLLSSGSLSIVKSEWTSRVR